MCLRFIFIFFTIRRFLGQICSELGQVFFDINIRLSSICFVVIFKIGPRKRVHEYSLLQILQLFVCFYLLLSVLVGVIELCLSVVRGVDFDGTAYIQDKLISVIMSLILR